jgi:uroporphyrinogen decarboxylase
MAYRIRTVLEVTGVSRTSGVSRSFKDVNDERIRIAEKLGRPDQVPVSPSMLGHFLTGLARVRMIEYLNDPKVMYNVQMLARKKFYDLLTLFPDYCVVAETSAFGCKIKWLEDNPPMIIPAITNPEDVDRIDVPDCYHDGYLPVAISTYRYMEQRAGPECVDFSFGAGNLGPFDTACLIRGQSQLFADIKLRPQLAHKILDLTSKMVIEWIKVRQEIAHQEFPRISFGDDFPGYLGPRFFKEFAFPYIKRVFEAFPNRLHWWHSDGDTTSVLELLPEMHVDVFVCFYPEVDIAVVKERIGDRICLMGNIHPLKTLLRGTSETVDEECKTQIEKAAEGGGYILSSGGETPRGVPEENIFAMIRAAEKYGKYPTRG